MPEISRFYGVVIRMYFGDHHPPHFHVEHAGAEVVIDIGTLGVLHGSLPPRVLGMVVEWASMHRAELRANWERAARLEPLERIDPLP